MVREVTTPKIISYWEKSMSHVNYDYLTESLLFSRHVEDEYSEVNEHDLRAELEKYRKYVLDNSDAIRQEAIEAKKKISVVIDSFQKLPDEKMLKQLALYIDCVMIADPIFELTEFQKEASAVMTEFIGMKRTEGIDRKKLAGAVKYMKAVDSLVACEFIKFIPITLIHESPKDIPICYDKENYRNSLPGEIMKFLQNEIKVCNIYPHEGALRIVDDKSLEKGTCLYINFPRCEGRSGEVVCYMKQEVESIEGDHVKFKLAIPDNITEYEFMVWLEQSKNKAAKHLYDETLKDLLYANSLGVSYLTGSQLIGELISKNINDSSVQSKIANLSMKLDLPVFEGAPLNSIIDIRTKYGESFENFRSGLGAKLLGINSSVNSEELKNQLEAVSYEINETYINDINRQINSLKRHLGTDVIVLTGSLLNNYVSGDTITLLSAVAAAADGVKESVMSYGNIKATPGYFLWKIDKEKNKAFKWY